MLKDLPANVVKDIAIAVVKETEETGEIVWRVYLLNLKKEKICQVLISSKGYGDYEGRKVTTTVLRHALGDVMPLSFVKVEAIIDKLFGLSNEYWISFSLGGVMYDKKYVFLPESIIEKNLVQIPLIGKMGVIIK